MSASSMRRVEVPTAQQRQVYALLATRLQAIENCKRSGNTEWQEKHQDRIQEIISDYMPSGAGWDSGTKLDMERSTPNKLVFYGDYYHMNEGGMYDGWTEHEIIVRPSLAFGFDLTITGRDRNDIKEYLHDMFYSALTQNVTHYWETQ